ncbi:delta-lactam-biosynthetic de-N-acetylase [Radiobacillus kanasensis]|uniref:delta-lactam-biosynthetic de-N-acetylase n=1 Tax=Radiobacillus kanasensis TaxID=2844358 RepID=UPI001E44D6EE|nr:delta-lactam-biosynthetic de-N-acetylase [Radiobacillus kanasensis]UFU00019.1 delta-lactam-biosynthetic de-N-acetylase [Radiobacillus kanasensis]
MKKIMFLMLTICLFAFPLSISANSYGWGFKKGNNHQPPDVGKYAQMLQGKGFYIDPSGEKVVYLTFDNGYEKGYTGQILDVLKEKGVPATFFVTGHYVDSREKLVKRMVKEGHIIGNHSYHHPDFTKLSKGKMKKELEELEQAVADITKQDSMKYLRPPRGTFSNQTLKWANEFGYLNMFWSLAFVDWNTDAQGGWQKSYNQVLKQVHPGAIILLHTVSKDNADALAHMIDDLRKQGYTFKSLDYLLMKNLVPKPLFSL